MRVQDLLENLLERQQRLDGRLQAMCERAFGDTSPTGKPDLKQVQAGSLGRLEGLGDELHAVISASEQRLARLEEML